MQTGRIQELNGWSERSWAQSEGEKGEEEGRSREERERGMEGGSVFIYLFIFHPQLNSSPMMVNQLQSSSAAINGPDAAAEHPGREGGLSSRGWIPSSLGGGHAPWTCPNRVLQHTPGLF